MGDGFENFFPGRVRGPIDGTIIAGTYDTLTADSGFFQLKRQLHLTLFQMK